MEDAQSELSSSPAGCWLPMAEPVPRNHMRLRKATKEKDESENENTVSSLGTILSYKAQVQQKRERKRKASSEDWTRGRLATAKSGDQDGKVPGTNEQEIEHSTHGLQECEPRREAPDDHQRHEHYAAAASAGEDVEATGTNKPKQIPETMQDQGPSPVPGPKWINNHHRKYVTGGGGQRNSLPEVLKKAQKVLRAGRRINDEIIDYYIALLQVTADEEALSIAFARASSTQTFRSFERIVFPVWTDRPTHWSVIIIEPAKHVISHFDPLQGTAGAEPLQDIGGLIRGWIGGVKQWKSEKRAATLAEDVRPADVADASFNNVGAAFRRRIMAELIANKVHPQDADIPSTLRTK
ncbi:hypothetical protein D0859_05945 [Hortaea werneckii]|uniref:Ubiquitin-like protease family profile domain-containing protein n=1 Tax=Hortaea werneckii TaxID=91943 RepID=A0A3M7IWV0_HORWE|nr:hypothetical protein D0859_05945 [Hortaea werneckii]